MNKNLNVHSDGERLWLWRQQEGLTGHQAAARLGVGRTAYWEVEGGRRTPSFPLPTPGRPSLPLLLQLARRRSGGRLHETARRAGCSHQTYLDWEREGRGKLRAFWEKQGFKFNGAG